MKIRGNPALDPSSFQLAGGAVGCLVIHGFTGTPLEMRLLGDYLHEKGLTVAGPLLKGHGTTPEDLNSARWQDWVASAEEALDWLQERCERVFVAGLSMGSLVAVHLAAKHPDLAGVLVYSPAIRLANRWAWLLPVVKRFIKQWPKEPEDQDDLKDIEARERLWHYDTQPTGGAHELLKFQRVVRREMADVSVPAIVFYSTEDHTIHETAGQYLFDQLGTPHKELVVYHNSGHCMTVDGERENIFVRSMGFIAEHAGGLL